MEERKINQAGLPMRNKKRKIHPKFGKMNPWRYGKMKTDGLEEEAGRDFIDRNTEGAQTLR